MLNVLFVTSDLTYIPENYSDALNEVISATDYKVSGVVFLKVKKIPAIKTALLLALAGCPRFSFHFFKNLISLLWDSRQKFAKKLNIPTYHLNTVNSDDFINLATQLKVDIIVNMRTRDIYKAPALKAAKLAALNVHHGLLPEWRGTMCDLFAISEGRAAGFSIHLMTNKLDDGQILKVQGQKITHRNYFKYLKENGKTEGLSIKSLLIEIQTLGKIPTGLTNHSDKINYSRTPNFSKIKELLKLGMQL